MRANGWKLSIKYQIENILRNPNKEKSTDFIRLYPQGGEVFLWISDKINDYVVDDFTWTHNGRHLLPESAPVIESTYYKAKTDKVVSNRIGEFFRMQKESNKFL